MCALSAVFCGALSTLQHLFLLLFPRPSTPRLRNGESHLHGSPWIDPGDARGVGVSGVAQSEKIPLEKPRGKLHWSCTDFSGFVEPENKTTHVRL